MQQSDEQRRTSRPSLLSEQPPAGDSQSILSKLDGRGSPANPKRAQRKSARPFGVLAGLAALAVAGGALTWGLQDSGTDRPVLPAPVAPAPVAVRAPAPPPPLVLAEAPPAAPEPQVSAATILDEPPAQPKPAPDKDELTALLDKPADADKPKVVKDEEPAKPAARKKPEPAKVARKEKVAAKDKKTAVATAPKKKPAAKAEPAFDSDAAVLAVLLAHSKAAAAPKPSRTATEYKRCGTLGSVAEADKCRERLCEATSKAKAECKTLRVAKVSS